MDVRFVDETSIGISWLVPEPMTRTSHALTHEGRAWLVDPVDAPEVVERALRLGEPAAVLQLLDRHNRDCAAIAARLGVPHEVAPTALPGTPFQVVDVLRRRRWNEVALWWPAERALVVAEAIGTNPFFTGGRDPAGVHPLLRLTPPRAQLGGFRPEHLLVGHGEGLHGEAAAEGLRTALARSRIGLPRILVKLPALAADARRRRWSPQQPG